MSNPFDAAPPTPWQVHALEPSSYQGRARFEIRRHGSAVTIATVEESYYMPSNVARATADLICAAVNKYADELCAKKP